VVKAGLQWQAGPQWTLRAGYSSGNDPIPSSQVLFNILAPGVIRQHVAVGATRALAGRVTGANPLEAPNQQSITLRMDQWDLEAGVTVRF